MSKRGKSGAVSAKSSGIVVGRGEWQLHFGLRARIVLLCVPLLLLAGGAYALYAHQQNVRRSHLVTQHSLQQHITSTDGLGDPAKLKADSTRLIQGAGNGMYDVPDKDLAQAHLARADVALNNGDYKPALADYKKAADLDPSLVQETKYGQFLCGYRLGERATLVPLVQALQEPLKSSHETGAQEQWLRYETYITDLLAGKDLDI